MKTTLGLILVPRECPELKRRQCQGQLLYFSRKKIFLPAANKETFLRASGQGEHQEDVSLNVGTKVLPGTLSLSVTVRELQVQPQT